MIHYRHSEVGVGSCELATLATEKICLFSRFPVFLVAMQTELKRQIGLFSAVMLIAGDMIGTGIFISTGAIAGSVVYSATKGAVDAVTRVLAADPDVFEPLYNDGRWALYEVATRYRGLRL